MCQCTCTAVPLGSFWPGRDTVSSPVHVSRPGCYGELEQRNGSAASRVGRNEPVDLIKERSDLRLRESRYLEPLADPAVPLLKGSKPPERQRGLYPCFRPHVTRLLPDAAAIASVPVAAHSLAPRQAHADRIVRIGRESDLQSLRDRKPHGVHGRLAFLRLPPPAHYLIPAVPVPCGLQALILDAAPGIPTLAHRKCGSGRLAAHRAGVLGAYLVALPQGNSLRSSRSGAL